MGWRYRKSFKLFPGVRLNVSSRGISTTIGARGASINVSRRGTYLNAGIPGTGLSYRQRIDTPPPTQPLPGPSPAPVIDLSPIAPEQPPPDIETYTLVDLHLPGAIKSAGVNELVSQGLRDLQSLLRAAVAERAAITADTDRVKQLDAEYHLRLTRLQRSWWARLFQKKKIATTVAEADQIKQQLQELEEQLQLCNIPIDSDLQQTFEESFRALQQAFVQACASKVSWDTTSAVATDRYTTRSAAGTTVTRRIVNLDNRAADVITSEWEPCHFVNANGGDIYLYPGFVLIYESAERFALIDWGDLEFRFNRQNFIESESIPDDAPKAGETWLYVNKNGTPDRRFSNNRMIPILVYGDLLFTTQAGLNEAYEFSNPDNAERLYEALKGYKSLFVR